MILIVDFGSQTAHLIGRRLRSLGVSIVYASPREALDKALSEPFKGIILSGGPSSVYDASAPVLDPQLFDLNIPTLGICYGWQLMATLLGGHVQSAYKEYGPEVISFSDQAFDLPEQTCQVYMSHGDSVVHLPDGFKVIGSTKSVLSAAVVHPEKQLYGLQFHPEVDHTEQGTKILEHFAMRVCRCKIERLSLSPLQVIKEIKELVCEDEVICGVSGGVDSSVAAFLIGRAIGPKLHPVYIESGLMRRGTKEKVLDIFQNLVKIHPIIVEAESVFLERLKGVEDPEEKRKIIGGLYVELFCEQAKKYPQAKFLGQGTIYSDVIESKGSTHASNIKSHHNVGGLPKDLPFQLLEPLRRLYKDEVRNLGLEAGLPREVVAEQPFPGPGYAVRIRGEVTPLRLAQVRQADDIVVEEVQKSGLYGHVFQCFALLTGAYSTAVKGDAREFSEVMAVRAYESQDVMTSQWARLPYDLLQKISSRIVNEVPLVSRVVYDITTKPPATMEWE